MTGILVEGRHPVCSPGLCISMPGGGPSLRSARDTCSCTGLRDVWMCQHAAPHEIRSITIPVSCRHDCRSYTGRLCLDRMLQGRGTSRTGVRSRLSEHPGCQQARHRPGLVVPMCLVPSCMRCLRRHRASFNTTGCGSTSRSQPAQPRAPSPAIKASPKTRGQPLG